MKYINAISVLGIALLVLLVRTGCKGEVSDEGKAAELISAVEITANAPEQGMGIREIGVADPESGKLLSPEATEVTTGITYTIVGIIGGSPCTAVQTGGLWRTCCDLQITNSTGADISGVVLIGWNAMTGSPEAARTGGNNSGYDGSGTGWRTTDGITPNPSANGGWTLWLKDDDATIETIENGASSALRRICIQSPTGYSVSSWRLYRNAPSGRVLNSPQPPNLWARLTNSTELGSGNLVTPDPDGYFAFPDITLTSFTRDIGAQCTPPYSNTSGTTYITASLDTSYRDYLNTLTDDAGMNLDRYIGLYTPSGSVSNCSGQWTGYYYNVTATGPRCLGRQGVADQTFKVSVRTADPTKVLIFLEGEEACYNGSAAQWIGCEVPPPCAAASDYAPCPGVDNGIFDLPDTRNPFGTANGNWSMIFVSQCDCSLYWGDNDPIYPETGRQYYHRGMKNLSAAVTLMKNLFPNAQKILVGGESSGGYGTPLAYMLVTTQYTNCTAIEQGDFTFNRYTFQGAGPDLENLTTNTGSQGYIMRDQTRAAWGFEQFIPPISECIYPDKCWWMDRNPATNDQPLYMVDWILTKDPKVRWGFTSYQRDSIIQGFIWFTSGNQYRDCALMPTSNDVNALKPNTFKRFMPTGTIHSGLFGDSRFYNVSVNGQFPYQWVNQQINNDPSWVDQVQAYTPKTCKDY